MNLEKAIEFMKQKHGNQKRKQGTPYYTHPLAVAELLKQKGFSEEYQLAGLFHDLLEDTDATRDEIISLSNEKVFEAVDLVTKYPGYKMSEYIANIKSNEIARAVKIADRIHNLSESSKADSKFQAKYIRETKQWYVGLAKGTVFEEDINRELLDIIKVYEKSEVER